VHPLLQEKYLSGTGEIIEGSLPNMSTTERKAYFNRISGGKRKHFWARYMKLTLLLHLLETMLYGYSARDGGDAAIKFALLLSEILLQCPTDYCYFRPIMLSLAELQLRRLDRLDGIDFMDEC
jgi:hypothetical protein